MTLKEYLRKNGESASSFAAKLGVSVSTVTRIANGETMPLLPLAQEIVAATGRKVRLADLVAP